MLSLFSPLRMDMFFVACAIFLRASLDSPVAVLLSSVTFMRPCISLLISLLPVSISEANRLTWDVTLVISSIVIFTSYDTAPCSFMADSTGAFISFIDKIMPFMKTKSSNTSPERPNTHKILLDFHEVIYAVFDWFTDFFRLFSDLL